MKRVLNHISARLIIVLFITITTFYGHCDAFAGTIFSDDFESYTLNTFPSSGGWQLIYNGAGTENQYVDNVHSLSGSQSLRLVGSSCWSAATYHAIDIPAHVTLEANVFLDDIVGCGCEPILASLGLYNPGLGGWGTHFGAVYFRCDGNIYAGKSNADRDQDVLLMPYAARTWYKVRLDVDLNARTYSVFIDGVLRGSNIQILDTGMPTGVVVSADHGANPVAWFDDVIVSSQSCACDLNTDSRCNMMDWLKFGQDWGRIDCHNWGTICECDLNDDGRCNMQDWLLFGKNWGRTDCPIDDFIKFADYFPLDPQHICTSTYEVTLGNNIGQHYTCTITGIETVPYTSGPLTGTILTTSKPGNIQESYLGFNNGLNVKFLGYNGYYFSTDCSLTGPPPQWTLGVMRDKMIIDQSSPYYSVNKNNSSDCVEDDNQKLLIRIGDVQVQGVSYPKAVIWYYLDMNYPFTTLNFYGKDTSLGITLPAGSDTEGYSVTAFDIYGLNTGLIASGDVDAATGNLLDLDELISISCP